MTKSRKQLYNMFLRWKIVIVYSSEFKVSDKSPKMKLNEEGSLSVSEASACSQMVMHPSNVS